MAHINRLQLAIRHELYMLTYITLSGERNATRPRAAGAATNARQRSPLILQSAERISSDVRMRNNTCEVCTRM